MVYIWGKNVHCQLIRDFQPKHLKKPPQYLMSNLLVTASPSVSSSGNFTPKIGRLCFVQSQSRTVRLRMGWGDRRSSSLSTFCNEAIVFKSFCSLELGIFTWIWSVWLKTGLLSSMISSVMFDQLLFVEAIVAWRKKRRAKYWTNIHQPPEPLRQGPGTRVLGQFWAGS